MARYTCPSCGAAFNGRKCRNCSYVHFSEEISHGLHTHKGEPLVVKAPTRRPVPRKDPFDCHKPSRKRSPLKTIVLVILLINLLPALFSGIYEAVSDIDVGASFKSPRSPEPEPLPIPENARQVYSQDGLTIYVQWEADPSARSIPVYVENDTDEDLLLMSKAVTVNGYLSDQSALYCDLAAGSMAKATLWLDEEDFQWLGIRSLETLAVQLGIYDESYNESRYVPEIFLQAQPSGDPRRAELNQTPEGLLLLEEAGLQVSFLGFESGDGDYELVFYLENTSDRTLTLSTAWVEADGEEVDSLLWKELAPGAKSLDWLYLFDYGTLPESLELTLEIDDWENGEHFTSEPIAVPLR